MKSINSLLIAAALVSLSAWTMTSCNSDLGLDDLDIEDSQPSASAVSFKNITVSLSAALEASLYEGTKALPDDGSIEEGTADDYKVLDFLLFQFDENGKRKGDVNYYKYEEGMIIPVIIPADEDAEYTDVIIANVHADAWKDLFSDVSDIETLKKKYYSVKNLQQMYGTDYFIVGGGRSYQHDLLMNGVKKVTIDTETLDCTLYRNVAKLTVTLNNPKDSGLKIISMQVRSIPSIIDWADQICEFSGIYPSTSKSNFFDYPVESFELTASETDTPNSLTFNYYMPRNMRGTSASTASYEKSFNTPSNATYIELYAIGDDGTAAKYTFYPGQNMVNDFNIIPNYHYNLAITFNNIGDPTFDSRVKIWPGVNTLEYSNCYIVNPSPADVQALYKIPVHERVNQFWTQEGGDNASGYTISAKTATSVADVWYAEVIWQDQPKQLIQFCDQDGNITGNNGTDSPVYEGQVTLNFRPLKGAEGNVLIGIKRKTPDPVTGQPVISDGYLWSWHLWITDYAPDECKGVNWTEGKYSYNVSDGQVHHYVGSLWDSEGAIYHNKWIMDRNLGALNTNVGSSGTATGGLFYQFGRKDPMRYGNSDTYYSISGVVKKNLLTSVGRSSNTVHTYVTKYPTQYIGFYLSQGAWNPKYMKDSELVDWLNPQWYTESKESNKIKSLYDPCPSGWVIPQPGTYDSFKTSKKPSWSNGYLLPIQNFGDAAWFPAGGNLYYHSFIASGKGSNGYIWMNNYSSFQVSSGNVSIGGGGSAYSTRCIQE